MTNELIKRAFSETEYTPETIQELKKCSQDPIYFIKNYIWLQHPLKGKVLFNLYDYQEELLKICEKESRDVALVSSQMGKCVVNQTLIRIRYKPSKLKLFILFCLNRKEFYNVTKLQTLQHRVRN